MVMVWVQLVRRISQQNVQEHEGNSFYFTKMYGVVNLVGPEVQPSIGNVKHGPLRLPISIDVSWDGRTCFTPFLGAVPSCFDYSIFRRKVMPLEYYAAWTIPFLPSFLQTHTNQTVSRQVGRFLPILAVFFWFGGEGTNTSALRFDCTNREEWERTETGYKSSKRSVTTKAFRFSFLWTPSSFFCSREPFRLAICEKNNGNWKNRLWNNKRESSAVLIDQ